MHINLHKNARTTPAIRRELQAATEPTKVLARRYHLSPITVRKWRTREGIEDASHRPHTVVSLLNPKTPASFWSESFTGEMPRW